MKVDLTDTEWLQLIDGEREDTGLPKCCANVSALRDIIIQMLRDGGELNGVYSAAFRRRYHDFLRGHDLPAGPLAKLAGQVDQYQSLIDAQLKLW